MWGTVVVGERGDYYAISLTGTEWGYLIALYLLCLVIRAIVILGEICLYFSVDDKVVNSNTQPSFLLFHCCSVLPYIFQNRLEIEL